MKKLINITNYRDDLLRYQNADDINDMNDVVLLYKHRDAE